MDCTKFYLPVPPRAWSRTEGRCITDITENVDPNNIAYINKGNILQYKKNSSQLTKNQRYAQIAKGLWTNRTKSFATQTSTYTNPNINNLIRVNYVSTTVNNNNPQLANIRYRDGGNLVCGTYENPCTGETIENIIVRRYYPTSDSDVPGPIQELYWDAKIPTWYPRVKRVMTNSGDKWPVNYKLLVSAIDPNLISLCCYNNNNNNNNIIPPVDQDIIIQGNDVTIEGKIIKIGNNATCEEIIIGNNVSTNIELEGQNVNIGNVNSNVNIGGNINQINL
jgi:hypothetical protein